MNKRRTIHVVGFFVLAIIFTFLPVSREPSYQGKSLSSWLCSLHNDPSEENRNEVRVAVTAMGTNSLPHLYRNVLYKPDWAKTQLLRLLSSLHLETLSNSRWIIGRESLTQPSLFAIQVLGTNALPLVPGFVGKLSDMELAYQALTGILSIGSPATQTIQELCGHSVFIVRASAANFLASTARGRESLKIEHRVLPNGDKAFVLIPVFNGYELTQNLQRFRLAHEGR